MSSLKVFVHGNPETAAIWRPLVDSLVAHSVDDDAIVLLSPPGFGASLPADFDVTADGYRDWLVEQLATIVAEHEQPIDIVGHDWGAGHVFNLVAARPDLVRSWAVDVGGLLHPDYEWHEAAQAWQTPEVGEEVIAMMVDTPIEDRVAMFSELGFPDAIADEIASAVDADMGRAILGLYRSAPEPELRALADRLAAVDRPPGLIITATADAYVGAELSGLVTSRFGCEQLILPDQGHWWMITSPDQAAAGLVEFWSRL